MTISVVGLTQQLDYLDSVSPPAKRLKCNSSLTTKNVKLASSPLLQRANQIATTSIPAAGSSTEPRLPLKLRFAKRFIEQISGPLVPSVPLPNTSMGCSRASSSTIPAKIKKTQISRPLQSALYRGYLSLGRSESYAEILGERLTPKLLSIIHKFRKSPSAGWRISKKRNYNKYPHSLQITKLENGYIQVHIYGHTTEVLGSGSFRSVKKSFTLIIAPNDESVLKITSLHRSKKNVSISTMVQQIRRHNKILKQFRIKHPGEKLHISPEMEIKAYTPHGIPKRIKRLELFQKRFVNSLQGLCMRRSQIQTAFTLLGAAQGVKQLHQMGYIHRDVKLDNILVSQKGTGYIHDFDYIEKLNHYTHLAERKLAEEYYAWDHLSDRKIVTPNCDIYGLALATARAFIPNFDKKVADREVKVDEVESKKGEWKLYKHKLDVCFKDPIEFIAACLNTPSKKMKFEEYQRWNTTKHTSNEMEAKLKELFPVEMFAFNMIQTELSNSHRLLIIHERNGLPRKFTQESWKAFCENQRLTSIDGVISQFEQLRQLALNEAYK